MFAEELHTGKVGEHICALRMLKAGIPVSIVNLETADVIAWYKDRVWRIQVKSSNLRIEEDRQAGYQFNVAVGGKKKRPLTHLDCDIVALVAIEHEQVLFCTIDDLQGQKTKRLPSKTFEDSDLCKATWQAALSNLSPVVT